MKITGEELEKVAMIAYEANRGFRLGLGDNSLPRWEDADGWDKDQCLNLVLSVIESDGKPTQDPAINQPKFMRELIDDAIRIGLEKMILAAIKAIC